MATQDRETTVQIPIAITWRISMATQDRETTVQIPTAKYIMADFNGYPRQGDNRPNTND
jgi:predicted component of type VI protein secretion system